MSGNLGDFEGRLVGSWKLDSLLGVRGSKAFYLTSSKKNSEDTALLLQLVSKRDEPEALGSWNRARKLTDCPLLHVHATGEAVLDGQPVAFAVLDLPDDDLSEVLAKRTLDATEAKSTFLSVAAGLDSLHQRGMMHGAVAAPNIFVVKDEMRLSVNNIAPGRPARGCVRSAAVRRYAGAGARRHKCERRDRNSGSAIFRDRGRMPQRRMDGLAGCLDPLRPRTHSQARYRTAVR